MLIARTLLWYFYGNSDKVYRAEVRDNGNGTFTLTAHWGRRGKTMQSQTKGTFHSKWEAMASYHELVDSKTAKGYQVTEQTPA